MHRKFFIGDTHFGHAGCLAFKQADGSPLRDFPCVEAMDEYMVERWNAVVRPVDTVYHCGDVVINRKALPILKRLNGKKVLIKGNHDIFKLEDYLPYFADIRACRVFPEHGLIASHIPIHPECLARWRGNVHGHLHSNTLTDPRYINISVEQIDYTPIEFDAVLARVPEQQPARESVGK